jgi:hypothetical protein
MSKLRKVVEDLKSMRRSLKHGRVIYRSPEIVSGRKKKVTVHCKLGAGVVSGMKANGTNSRV